MSIKYAACLLLAAGLLVGISQSGAAQIVPVSLDNSGFSVDAIWEAGGGSSGDLSGDGSGASSYALVTSGYAAAHTDTLDPTSALPDNGTITSPSGAVFQLQPYDEANVLVLNGSPATLTLAPSAQASYSEISFLVNNLSSNRRSSGITFTLNYTNGPSVTLPTTDPVSNIASAPSSDAVAAVTLDSYIYGGSPQSSSTPIFLDEYDFAVSAPLSEILQSVTIDPGADQLDVFAVSGTDPAPEPPTWLLLLTALGGGAVVARRPRVRA